MPLRPVRPPATRRRPAAPGRLPGDRRDRLPRGRPVSRPDHRQDARADPLRPPRRHDLDDRHVDARPVARLRPLPRAQVRPDPAAGLLSPDRRPGPHRLGPSRSSTPTRKPTARPRPRSTRPTPRCVGGARQVREGASCPAASPSGSRSEQGKPAAGLADPRRRSAAPTGKTRRSRSSTTARCSPPASPRQQRHLHLHVPAPSRRGITALRARGPGRPVAAEATAQAAGRTATSADRASR